MHDIGSIDYRAQAKYAHTGRFKKIQEPCVTFLSKKKVEGKTRSARDKRQTYESVALYEILNVESVFAAPPSPPPQPLPPLLMPKSASKAVALEFLQAWRNFWLTTFSRSEATSLTLSAGAP
jgi:hypothetical protein